VFVEDPVEVAVARFVVQLKRAKNIRPSMKRAPAAAKRGRKMFPCNDRAADRSPAISASTPVMFIVD
jgi:hypothetical protein